jgi:type II secretory ATPase GspE/PulE/Tfp pilus assembly ATPase PilB-like protein
MSNEIDISNPDSFQGGGYTDAWQVLRLILAQAVADSSSAVMFQQTREDTTLRYEVKGHWYEMVPPPPEIMRLLLGILKEKAGLSPEASWGEGDILLRTSRGPVVFRLSTCVDPQGRSVILAYRAAASRAED